MKAVRLGIVGAESSHSYILAQICNAGRQVPMRVTHLWGETEALARASAAKGGIPHIVRNWRKMAGEVDGIMIDHRHGKHHAPVARYFLEQGIPVFVDKPITCDLGEAKELFRLAERHGAPLATFSVKPLAERFRRYVRRLHQAGLVRAFHSSGPAELDSPYGGIFFYGIHQVECVLEVLGARVQSAFLQRIEKSEGLATMTFDNAFATLNFLPRKAFHWTAVGDRAVLALADDGDPQIFVRGARLIYDLVREGKAPFSRERMLAPIAVLEAMQTSLGSGKPVRVDSL